MKRKGKKIKNENIRNTNLLTQVFLKPNASADKINEFINRIEKESPVLHFNLEAFVFYTKADPEYVKKCDRDLNVLSSWNYIATNNKKEMDNEL